MGRNSRTSVELDLEAYGKHVISKKRLIIFSILIFLALELGWPLQSSVRPLWPLDMVDSKRLVEQSTVIELSKGNASKPFVLAIGVPTEALEREVGTKSTENINLSEYRKQTEVFYQKRPYFRVNELWLPIDYKAGSAECEVVLKVGVQSSLPVECKKLNDKNFSFLFESDLLPGLHQSQFALTEKSSTVRFESQHWTSKKNNLNYLQAHSFKRTLTGFEVLKGYYHGHRKKIVLYLLALSGMLFILIKELNSSYSDNRAAKSSVAFLLLTCLALIFALPYYNGYDETAHIDMFYRAPLETPKAHFNKVRVDMLNSDFHRAHGSRFLPPDVCPHSILKTCGVSDRPMLFYSHVKSFLPFKSFVESHPTNVQNFMRAFNFLCLAAFIGLVSFFCSLKITHALCVALAFVGAFSIQSASVTNDVVMYLAGFFIAAIFVRVTQEKINKRTVLASLLSLAFLFVVSNYDRSWIAAVPMALSLVALAAFNHQLHKRNAPLAQKNILLFFLLSVGLSFSILTWASSPPSSFNQKVTTFYKDAELLLKQRPFDFVETLSSVAYYLKSTLGNYFIGSRGFSAFEALLIFCAILFSHFYFSRNVRSSSNIITWLFIGACCGIQLWLVVSISFLPGSVEFQKLIPFLQPRLSAPGLGAILLLFLWFYTYSSSEKGKRALQVVSMLVAFHLVMFNFYRGSLLLFW